MNDWYLTLQRPPLTPPNWVFGPAWTILYIMIAASIILFIRQPKAETPTGIYILLAIHLVTNFIWTPLFFQLRSPALALLDIVVLDLTLILLISLFWKYSKPAAFLLIPYCLWVLFATYLNAGFLLLNR